MLVQNPEVVHSVRRLQALLARRPAPVYLRLLIVLRRALAVGEHVRRVALGGRKPHVRGGQGKVKGLAGVARDST